MITLKNGDREIDFTLSSTTVETKTVTNKTTVEHTTYTPELPKINCNNESDAVRIQEEINAFTNKLVKDLLK